MTGGAIDRGRLACGGLLVLLNRRDHAELARCKRCVVVSLISGYSEMDALSSSSILDVSACVCSRSSSSVSGYVNCFLIGVSRVS